MPGVQVGVGYIDIKPDLSGFGRQLRTEVGRGVSAAGDDAGKTLKTKLAGAVKAAAAGFAAVKITDFLGATIRSASDLNESLSKSNNVFKSSAGEIDKWSKTAATGFGLSRQQALEAASTFGNMFAQLGIGGAQAATMSESIVQLAADFASFHNANIEDVIVAQSAAFRGEYDSLQRFLPLINAATVEQRALQLTGKRTTKELTAQDKALAVNALMFEGAGDAQGDFGRTSGELANQQRIMNAQWADAKAELGTGLIPVMKGLAEILNNDVIPAFKTLFLAEGADATGWAATLRDAVGDTVGFIVQALAVLDRAIASTISAIPGGWGEGVADNLRVSAAGLDDMAVSLHASTGELLNWKSAAGGTPASAFGAAIKGWLPDLKTSTGLIKGSAEALRELGKAGRDAAAGERDLKDARRDLAKLLATGAVDEEKVADARRSLAEATRSAAHADRDLADAQQEYDAALANANDLHGFDTAQEVLADAADNLADAQETSADAHERARDAEKELREAQVGDPEYQDKIAAARDRVADATDKVATTTDALAKLTPSLTGAMNGMAGGLNNAKDAAHGLNTELGFTKENLQEILDITAMGGSVGGSNIILDPLLAGVLPGLGGTTTQPTTVATAPTNALAGTTNNFTINAMTSEADARQLAKEVMWNL